MKKTKCPKCGYEWPEDSIYWQRNPRYKGLKLGKSNTDWQQNSCALMSLSYIAERDPLEVNQLFIDEEVYSKDLINFEKAGKVLGLGEYRKYSNISNMPESRLSIKEVKLGRGQHFVVRINENGKRSIYDPWTNKILPINFYPFISYRCYGDIS